LFFAGLSACSVLKTPVRPLAYDFGPGPVAPVAATRMAPLPTLAVADVEAPSFLDTSAMLYRLAYSETQQLSAYTQARWSMAPAQLMRQRLRDQLGQRRTVLNPAQGAAARVPVMVLRVELEEFSQLFESPKQSSGLLRVRATLGQAGSVGEKLLAQRSFVVTRPAASADAAGGVRALTAAADAAIQEIDAWVQQVEAGGAER